MFKIIAALALIAGAVLPSPVTAQTFGPTSTDVYFYGYARLGDGHLACDLSFTVSIDATGSATVLDPTFGGANPWCSTAALTPYGTWTITPHFFFEPRVMMNVGYSILGNACSDLVLGSFAGGASWGDINISSTELSPIPPNYGYCAFEASVWSNQSIWISY